jgi:hypothetical protein
MNRFQRFAVRIATRVAPQLREFFRVAGVREERLSEALTLYRERGQILQDAGDARLAELREAVALQEGSWLGGEVSMRVRESDAPGVVQCKERLAELELALEDRGWKRVLALADMEFSRWGIQQIILIARLFRVKNPIVQRGILVHCYYVFARSFEISCEDETTNQVVQAFFQDPRNQQELSQTALMEKNAAKWTDGNIFWTIFSDQATGETLVRSLDAIEIQEIITNPDDASETWFYQRAWMSQTFNPTTGVTTPVKKEGWYIDVKYDGPVPPAIKGVEMMKDTGGQYIRIKHRKCGAITKWRFGCPRTYAALDWARAYRENLENYASIVKAHRMFAWDVETKGGAPSIAATKQEFATTLANDGTSVEQNPTPVVGSAFIHGPGMKANPVRTAGLTPSPDESRRLAHMAYMVFGLAEHFFADLSTGNLATATSLDRPTELMFIQEQEEWSEDLKDLARIAVQRSKSAPKGRLREAISKGHAKQEVEINVNFPAILEGDLPANIGAVVNAMTLAGSPVTGIDAKTGTRLLLTLVASLADFPMDIEEVIDAMYPDTYDPDRTKEPPDANAGGTGAPGQQGGGNTPQVKPSEREAILERAVSELQSAYKRLKG